MTDIDPMGEFDSAEVQAAAERIVGDSLLIFAVYDPKRFVMKYIDETVDGGYGDMDEMFEVSTEIHKHLYLDHLEKRLMGDVHPTVGNARSFVTYLENVTMVRILEDGNDAGVFFAIDRDAPVTELVDAVYPLVNAAED